MEVIRLAGYSEEEKLEITRRHVLPRQLTATGLDERDRSSCRTRPCALIITDYTREAGLRDLERQIARIARKVARQMVEDREAGKKTARANVTPEKLRKYLGPAAGAAPRSLERRR